MKAPNSLVFHYVTVRAVHHAFFFVRFHPSAAAAAESAALIPFIELMSRDPSKDKMTGA